MVTQVHDRKAQVELQWRFKAAEMPAIDICSLAIIPPVT